MSREAAFDQSAREIKPAANARHVRIDTDNAQALGEPLRIVPPRQRLGDAIDDFFTNVERAADIAQRRASAIADHRRRDRRTLAPVLLEHVLDHLFAPLVLEVDVDDGLLRSEEHTSELQSLMRISYAVFCLKKKN